MEKRYAAPDEVLYHIGFSANDIKGAKIAILPGDPGRVEGLAKSPSLRAFCSSFCCVFFIEIY